MVAMKKFSHLIPLILLTIIPTLAIWLPFFAKVPNVIGVPIPLDGMATVIQNYDGPLYLVVAKTFYNIAQIKTFEIPLPVEYYAAHFPLFPVLIKLVSLVITYPNTPYAMLMVTVFSSFLALFYFHKLISQYVSEHDALFLSAVFAIFPARWLIVRSVGSPEPLFLAALIASIYYFQNKKYWAAGLWGAVAQFTKSPGILLFAAYFFAIVIPDLKRIAVHSKFIRHINWRAWPVILVPLALLGVFGIYQLTYGNFWQYFNSGDNIHLFFPPFQIFNYTQPWVQTPWLEEIIFIYMFGIMSVVSLFKQKQTSLFFFSLIFFGSIIFVSHRDLMRYSLPLVPFMLVAFRQQLLSKEFKFAFVFLIIPIYLYSLAFISQNVMPISNWQPLL